MCVIYVVIFLEVFNKVLKKELVEDFCDNVIGWFSNSMLDDDWRMYEMVWIFVLGVLLWGEVLVFLLN